MKRYLNFINESKILKNKILTKEQVKKAYSSYVNWDLISDIKQLSLDYLDLGLELNLLVMSEDGSIFYSIIFSHEKNESGWSEQTKVNTEGIYYYMFFTSKLNPNITSLILRNSTNELRDIISEMYPNDRIEASHHYYDDMVNNS